MSGFCCIADRTPLEHDRAGLRCPRCGAINDVEDGIALLARGATRSQVDRPIPLLDGLASRMRDGSADAEIHDLCGRTGLHRSPAGSAWKLLLPVPAGASVLEIGPGVGDTTADLAARATEVVVLAAHRAAARIVASRLGERGFTPAGLTGGPGVRIAVIPGLERLPCPDSAFQAAAFEETSAAAFSLGRGGLAGFAAELGRVMAPGGAVFFGLSSPLHRLPGVRYALERVGGGETALDSALRIAQAVGRPPSWGRRRVIAAMLRAGFRKPEAFAPLPGHERPRAIVPLSDPAVVRYFLRHQVRRNALASRLAVWVAETLLAAGLFDRVVPYHYLIFRKPERAALGPAA